MPAQECCDSGVSPAQLREMRSRLHALLSQVFSAHPALRYYQGMHDIISILTFVFPPEARQDAESVATALCLRYLRDHHTTTLEPSLGYLRLLQNLLKQADPKLAALVET